MVRVQKAGGTARTYKTRRYTPKQLRQKLPSISVMQCLSQASNKQAQLQFVQGVLDIHCPGATALWTTCSFLVLTGNDLKDLFNNAFRNVDGIHYVGIKVTGMTVQGAGLLIGYRQGDDDQLRVISNTSTVNGTFMFKDGRLPKTLVIVSQTNATFRLKMNYKPNLVSSLL